MKDFYCMSCGVEVETMSICTKCWHESCLECYYNQQMEHGDNCCFTE